MKIKVGIFFGGPSRQRELSFISGREYFMHLDRRLFEPVPILVDSRRQFLLLDWAYFFEPSLQAFFPPREILPPSHHSFPIYEESLGALPDEDYDRVVQKIGRKINSEELPQLVNFAIIALHGEFGEDGQLQAELDGLRIPYSGSSSLVCRYNIDPLLQKKVMEEKGFSFPRFWSLSLEEWKGRDPEQVLSLASRNLGFPFQIYPSTDPHSAAPIDEEAGLDAFREAVESAFFQERIPVSRWQGMGSFDRIDHIRFLTDLRAGLGFPVQAVVGHESTLITHPEELLNYLNRLAGDPAYEQEVCHLKSTLSTDRVLLESRVMGEPFSIVVVRQGAQSVLALPPVKPREEDLLYSRSAPGGGFSGSSPFEASVEKRIRKTSEQLFQACGAQSFAVVEGLVDIKGNILFKTLKLSGSFSPESPLFLSGPAIGLAPGEWISYLVRISLQERIQEHPGEMSYRGLQSYLEELMNQRPGARPLEERVAVVFSRDSPDPAQTPESARRIVQYLAATGNYLPVPMLIEPHAVRGFTLHTLAPASFWGVFPGMQASDEPLFADIRLFAGAAREIRPEEIAISALPGQVGVVVIDARTGPARGLLQRELERLRLPFTGPGAAATGIVTHRQQSLQVLSRTGHFSTSEQLLLQKQAFESDPSGFLQRVESRFSYPFLARSLEPDFAFDTLVLNSRQDLEAFTRLSFRPANTEGAEFRRILRLKAGQSIPAREQVLFQEIVHPGNAKNFIPLSLGVFSYFDEEGNIRYEILEPSERMTSWYTLTPAYQLPSGVSRFGLPARLSENPHAQILLSASIKSQVEKAARLLGLNGPALIDVVVQIFEDDSAKPIVEEIHAFPGWEIQSPLVHQLVYEGIYPGERWDQLIQGSKAQIRWAALQKEAQTEHIFAHTSPFLTPPTPEESHSEGGQQNSSSQAMESPTPLPTPRKKILPELPSTGIMGVIQDSLWDIWYFISSAIFLKNLVAALLSGVVLFLLTTLGLKLYTHHGQSVEVQDYRGMEVREAKRKARARSFDVLVNDSVYIVGKAEGIILDQTPKPASRIKKNRNIYLTVSSGTPPSVPLPDLIGGNDDFDQYKKKLDRLGIQARIKDREFNADLEDNTILYLVFEGRRISAADLKRGVEVPKGSTIDFIVSIRNTGTVDIPDLVCLTYEEAAFLLQSSQLVVGSVFSQGETRPGLFVYKQEPAFSAEMKLNVGEQVNLYLTETRPQGCAEQ